MASSLAIITGIMKRYQAGSWECRLDFGCTYIGNYDAPMRVLIALCANQLTLCNQIQYRLTPLHMTDPIEHVIC